MRTHPLVAAAVVAAAITTMTVFGQSVPLPAPLKKLRRPSPAVAARPAASSAVPAWLAAPAATTGDAAATPTTPGRREASATIGRDR